MCLILDYRHPLYKIWWDAFEIEIPHLVKKSTVAGQLKPEIKLVRLMKSPGGYVSGSRQNKHRFISTFNCLSTP